ncbi:MAG: hypothetical protein WA354_12950 [Terracidiphilus sp.]
MVTVVLLTTLITPLIMRGAFMIKRPQDEADNKRDAFLHSSMAETEAEARCFELTCMMAMRLG